MLGCENVVRHGQLTVADTFGQLFVFHRSIHVGRAVTISLRPSWSPQPGRRFAGRLNEYPPKQQLEAHCTMH